MEYRVGDYSLKEIQTVMLEMLADIDRVCVKNNINYSLDSGTMLGAVRHQGFIPWDDDMDIAMTRDDYIKFTEIANKELDGKYQFQCMENTKEYPYNFGKVFCVNTTYTESFTAKLNICHGIYIDVFPMDYVDVSRPKWLAFNRSMVSKFTQLRYAHLNMISGKRYALLKHLPLKLINTCCKKHMMYCYKKRGAYVQKLCHYGKNKPPIRSSFYTDTIRVPFENYEFPISRDYDEFLRGRYGDYMRLPSKEQQKPNHSIIGVKL